MNDSNATLAAFGAGLLIMLGYALTVAFSLARACRTAPEAPRVSALEDAPKAAVTSEVKPTARIRASSR